MEKLSKSLFLVSITRFLKIWLLSVKKRRGRRGQDRQSRQSFLNRKRRPKGGNGVMLDFGIEKLFRDAAIFLHMDATADVSPQRVCEK